MDKFEPGQLAEEFDLFEQENEALGGCLKELKSKDQQLLHTRYATDVSLETYAQQESIPVGTLKAKLYRLRGILRRCIEKQISPPH